MYLHVEMFSSVTLWYTYLHVIMFTNVLACRNVYECHTLVCILAVVFLGGLGFFIRIYLNICSYRNVYKCHSLLYHTCILAVGSWVGLVGVSVSLSGRCALSPIYRHALLPTHTRQQIQIQIQIIASNLEIEQPY